MAKVAIVTPQLPAAGGKMGGVGTFALHWSQLLQQAGEDVTLVLTNTWLDVEFDASWRNYLEDQGLEIIELMGRGDSPDRQPDIQSLEMSERVADLIAPFSAAYFQDGMATIPIRRRRLP